MISNQPPLLDLDLGETADQIRDTVRSFTQAEIAPLAAEIDRTDEFPRHLWPKLGELGLHGITVEEEYGDLHGSQCPGGSAALRRTATAVDAPTTVATSSPVTSTGWPVNVAASTSTAVPGSRPVRAGP